MNNKGFTMIELLAIITVLVTILLISFPTLINMTRRDKEKQYNDMVNTICKAGETYIYSNENLFPDIGTEGTITYIDIDDLMEDDLVDKSTINPKTGNNLSGPIKFTTNEDKSLKCYYDEEMPIPNMLTTRGKKEKNDDTFIIEGSTFLNTGVHSLSIGKLFIHNIIEIPEGYEQTDCSYLQDESVICYWKEEENDGYHFYDMHIAANGDVYTPYDSSYLFFNLDFTSGSENDGYRIEVNLTGLNTKFTKNMSHMFDCFSTFGGVSKLNLGDKFDTSKVTDMSGMFLKTGFENLIDLNLGDKFDTSNVINMSDMFSETGNKKMTSLNLGDKFDTSKVTDMSGMFFGFGGRLYTLNLGDKFDTSNVTDMSNMFKLVGVSSDGLTSSRPFTLNLGKKFVISNETETKYMFEQSAESRDDVTIKVGSQKIKDKILSLTDAEIPQRFIENNLIIVE